MNSASDTVAAMVKQAEQMGGKLDKLEVGAAMFAELGGRPDQATLVVHGVPIFLMSERNERLHAVVLYAYHRWNTVMSHVDAESLMKAVPDAELMSLAPLIVDQHLDDHGYEDPVDEYDTSQVDELQGVLENLGFIGVEL